MTRQVKKRARHKPTFQHKRLTTPSQDNHETHTTKDKTADIPELQQVILFQFNVPGVMVAVRFAVTLTVRVRVRVKG
jgi:hypothetical protein